MTNLVTVPQGGNMLDVLAERYRAAFDKVKGGREQWIEGSLELAVVIAEARDRPEMVNNAAFNRWLQRHEFDYLSPNDRVALFGFSRDLAYARKLLESSNSTSWRVIWETRPKGRQMPPIKNDRRQQRSKSGYARAHRVPTVMRDETPVPPSPPPKQLSEMFLTPEQVDPDFKGTPLEFTTKYGHVLLHTKDQIEQTKRQESLSAWLGTVADLERTGRTMLAALAKVDPATVAEWAGKPAKAEKSARLVRQHPGCLRGHQQTAPASILTPCPTFPDPGPPHRRKSCPQTDPSKKDYVTNFC